MTSAFFPNAATETPTAPAPAPLKAPPASVTITPQPLPWEGIRVVSGERVRFPQVRSALWDRTSRAASVDLTPVTPRLSLLPQVLTQLAQHAAASTGAATTLQATLAAVPATDVAGRAVSGGTAFVDVSAHTLVSGSTTLQVRRQQPGIGHGGAQPCAVAVHAGVWPASGELRPPADAYGSLLKRSLEALEGNLPLLLGEATPMHCAAACTPDGSGLLVRVEALVPTLSLKATPLYALAVMRSPLSDSLRDAGMRQQLRTGYLTMDQGRKLVVLSEGDPKAFEVPLVGVWASGIKAPTDPLAWAACVRYARLKSGIAEKVNAPDDSGAFLMLLYEEWSEEYGGVAGASVVSPQLYEVTPQGTYSPYKLVARGLQVPLPVPTTAEHPASCDLFTSESAEVARLMRTLEPMPEGAATKADAGVRLAQRPNKRAAAQPLTECAITPPTTPEKMASEAPAKARAETIYRLSAPPLEAAPAPSESDGADKEGGGVRSATETALVAMVSEMQSQMKSMSERLDQQQVTIARLTSELTKAALDQGAPFGTTSAALLASSVRGSKKKGQSHEAMRAAVLIATEEERLASTHPPEAGGVSDDDVDDAPMLSVDPKEGDAPKDSEGDGPTEFSEEDLSCDIYEDVPRIVYAPDDDDADSLEDEEGEEEEETHAELTAAMDEEDEFGDEPALDEPADP